MRPIVGLAVLIAACAPAGGDATDVPDTVGSDSVVLTVPSADETPDPTSSVGLTDTSIGAIETTDTSVPGREGYRQAIQAFMACLRDADIDAKLTTATADRITVTTSGPMAGADPAGCFAEHIGRYPDVDLAVVESTDDSRPIVTTTIAPSGSVELDWSVCVMDLRTVSFAVGPGWLEGIEGMAEFDPTQLQAVLDRNQRNELQSIVATAADGTIVDVLDTERGAAIHTAFGANIEDRLRGAVQRGAVVWSWLFDRPLDGMHSFDAFLPDGSRVDLNGCGSPATGSVDEYAATVRPGDTEYEVWKAVMGDPAVRQDYIDWYNNQLAAQDAPPPAWVDLDPYERQVGAGDEPPSVADSLIWGNLLIELAGDWSDLDGAVCQHMILAWGPCFGIYGNGSYHDVGFVQPGDGFSIWMQPSASPGDRVRIADISAAAAAIWSDPDPGPERFLRVTLTADVDSFDDLESQVANGTIDIVIDVIDIDELGD